MFNFGQRLRRLRELRGMSQKALATELSIPQTTISFLENRSELPRTELLQRIMDFFQVDISFFKEDNPVSENEQVQVDAYLSKLIEIKTGGIAAHLNSNIANDREKLDKPKKNDN